MWDGGTTGAGSYTAYVNTYVTTDNTSNPH